MAGNARIKSLPMNHRGGKVHDTSWKLPNNVPPAAVRVAVSAMVPGLGRITGVKTLKQIAEGSPPPSLDRDKPSVKTTPLPPKVSPKPKPVPRPPVKKPPVKKTPATKPVPAK
jgi:hypothetical protein